MAKAMSCCSGEGCGTTLGVLLFVIGLVWVLTDMKFFTLPFNMWALVFLLFGLKYLVKSFK